MPDYHPIYQGIRVRIVLTGVDNRILESQPESLFSRNTSNWLSSSIQENSLNQNLHTDFLMESAISMLQKKGRVIRWVKVGSKPKEVHFCTGHTNMKGLNLSTFTLWATI